MKLTLIAAILFLSLSSFGQCIISIKIKIDDTPVDSLTNDLKVKIKFNDKSDTLTFNSNNGVVNIPWLYKEINYFEVFYKGYFVNMTEHAAQVEGQSLFDKSNHNWFITIDKFPYSAITKERFPKIKKPQYSFIIKTDKGYAFNGIGRK
jgi:hypothetical protein